MFHQQKCRGTNSFQMGDKSESANHSAATKNNGRIASSDWPDFKLFSFANHCNLSVPTGGDSSWFFTSYSTILKYFLERQKKINKLQILTPCIHYYCYCYIYSTPYYLTSDELCVCISVRIPGLYTICIGAIILVAFCARTEARRGVGTRVSSSDRRFIIIITVITALLLRS